MPTYCIKNWDHFQHYRDRNPPWIKLHYELLSSSDWVILDDPSRVLAIACMLVASRSKGANGEIDGSDSGLAYLKRVAYLNKTPNLTPLILCGFLVPASTCKQMQADAISETETETETETESTWVSGDPPASTPPPLSLNGWGTPEALMALYNDSCPVECPAAETLSPKRKEMAKRILKAFPDKTYWVEAFAEVCKTPFLRGMCPPSKGHNKSFIANFDWFLSCSKSGVENVVSVWERKYGH